MECERRCKVMSGLKLVSWDTLGRHDVVRASLSPAAVSGMLR